MKALDLLWTLLKLSLIAVGILYAIQVLAAYLKAGSSRSALDGPVIEGKNWTRLSWRLLVWAGVMLIGIVLRLARPVANVLSEASAEIGEWAINRTRIGAAAKTRER